MYTNDQQNIRTTRGEDLRFVIPLTDTNGNPFDITNYSFLCRLFDTNNNATGYTFNITKIQSNPGIIELLLPGSVTAMLLKKIYFAITQVTLPNGEKQYFNDLKFILFVDRGLNG